MTTTAERTSWIAPGIVPPDQEDRAAAAGRRLAYVIAEHAALFAEVREVLAGHRSRTEGLPSEALEALAGSTFLGVLDDLRHALGELVGLTDGGHPDMAARFAVAVLEYPGEIVTRAEADRLRQVTQ